MLVIRMDSATPLLYDYAHSCHGSSAGRTSVLESVADHRGGGLLQTSIYSNSHDFPAAKKKGKIRKGQMVQTKREKIAMRLDQHAASGAATVHIGAGASRRWKLRIHLLASV